MVCHSSVTIFAFNSDIVCMELIVVPKTYLNNMKHFQQWMEEYFITICMKIWVFQNNLEAEPHNFIKDTFQPMVFIHYSIQFSLLRTFENILMELKFIIWLAHVIFTFFNNLWVMNVVNSTNFILLKQNFRGIIIIIVICRNEFIQKMCTYMNLLQSNFNIKYCGTSAH